MKQRSTSAGGECHATQVVKGHAREVLGSGARKEAVRVVGLPLVLPGTKFLRSESSLTSPQEVQRFSWRPSFFPFSAGTGQQQSPGLCKNESTEEGGAQLRVGVGSIAHNEGPLERSSKFLKSGLLECEATTTSSLGAKCVCHYSRRPARPPAPPSPPRKGAQPERTAGLAPVLSRTSLIPQTAGELPKPAPPLLALSRHG